MFFFFFKLYTFIGEILLLGQMWRLKEDSNLFQHYITTFCVFSSAIFFLWVTILWNCLLNVVKVSKSFYFSFSFLREKISYLSLVVNFFPFLHFSIYYIRKNIGIGKFFDFRFLMDLHLLGCLENDLTIYIKACLSPICVWYTFCGRASAKTYGWNCIKFYMELHLIINW